MKTLWQKLKMFFSNAEKVQLATALVDFFVAVVTAATVIIPLILSMMV